MARKCSYGKRRTSKKGGKSRRKRVSKRRSRRRSRRSKKMSRRSRLAKLLRKVMRRRRGMKRRFGRMSGLESIMGNFAPSQMGITQNYLGMPPGQYARHMKGVAPSDQLNFYTTIPPRR